MTRRPPAPYDPPPIGRWILGRLISPDLRYVAMGDFDEKFAAIAAEKGAAAARIWFWGQILKSVPHFLADFAWWTSVMFKNHMLVALRDLKKNKIFALINIFSLSIGLACSIVIMLFVRFETSFDRYHENADRIFRVVRKRAGTSGEEYSTITPWMMRMILVNSIPEVEDAARLDFHRSFVIRFGDKSVENDILYADPNLLNLFSFPLLRGDKKTVLRDPNSAVVSENFAGKLFGREDPLGKVITTYYEGKSYDLMVTGILKNIPQNSHFRVDILVPLEHLFKRHSKQLYRLNSVATYLLLKKGVDLKDINAKFAGLAAKLLSKTSDTSYVLQPLASIHFHSTSILSGDIGGRLRTCYFLSAMALLILLVACVNFIGLSTARSVRRSREVGLRRTAGADRGQLFAQFLGESFFLSLIALAFALLLTFLFLPVFNALMNREIRLSLIGSPGMILGLTALTVVCGLIAGGYPAFVLSSYGPAEALKGRTRKSLRSGAILRKGLVVFQFAVSMVFIAEKIAMASQLRYSETKDLGFEKSHIVGIDILRDENLRRQPEMIREKIRRLPGVEDVAVTYEAPGWGNGMAVQVQAEGSAAGRSAELTLDYIQVGDDFFRFFGIEMAEGRDFNRDTALSDAASSVILNEKAVKALGWPQPLGRLIHCRWIERAFNVKGPFSVIGVVKDYHNGSLHQNIEPTMYFFDPGKRFQIFARVRPDRLMEFVAALGMAWKDMNSILPFDYYFLDDWMDKYLYGEDRRIGRVFALSSALALVLACLGLLGLASFAAESRRKEIGIRKVLGATAPGIVGLFCKEFAALAAVSSLLAWPVGYYFIRLRLRDFAYRIGMDPWIFLLASGLVLAMTLVTVGLQSFRASVVNPADTLRHE